MWCACSVWWLSRLTCNPPGCASAGRALLQKERTPRSQQPASRAGRSECRVPMRRVPFTRYAVRDDGPRGFASSSKFSSLSSLALAEARRRRTGRLDRVPTCLPALICAAIALFCRRANERCAIPDIAATSLRRRPLTRQRRQPARPASLTCWYPPSTPTTAAPPPLHSGRDYHSPAPRSTEGISVLRGLERDRRLGGGRLGGLALGWGGRIAISDSFMGAGGSPSS